MDYRTRLRQLPRDVEEGNELILKRKLNKCRSLSAMNLLLQATVESQYKDCASYDYFSNIYYTIYIDYEILRHCDLLFGHSICRQILQACTLL